MKSRVYVTRLDNCLLVIVQNDEINKKKKILCVYLHDTHKTNANVHHILFTDAFK